jgi:hypothetical protein
MQTAAGNSRRFVYPSGIDSTNSSNIIGQLVTGAMHSAGRCDSSFWGSWGYIPTHLTQPRSEAAVNGYVIR